MYKIDIDDDNRISIIDYKTSKNTKTKGEVNSLRVSGNVPAIIYGGTEENKKISASLISS